MTVVIANWNSLGYLAVSIEAIRRFSPPETRILVVDNHSVDGSRRWLRRVAGVDVILLPANIWHGPALDIGMLAARTEYLVSLDVDAFPISTNWLRALLDPLDHSHVVGVHMHRGYAHPCCLAIRRQRFLGEAHTFAADYQEEGLGSEHWDVGELISIKERPAITLIEKTEQRGPGGLGITWDGVVYHNGYAVRHLFHFGPDQSGQLDRAGVRAEDAVQAWDEACRRHLGLSSDERTSLIVNGPGSSRPLRIPREAPGR